MLTNCSRLQAFEQRFFQGVHPGRTIAAAAITRRIPMNTLVPASTGRHQKIRITTDRPTEFIDLTARLEALVAASGIRVGFVNVQTLHTTTAIVVNELEPLLLADFETVLANAAPCDAAYRHDDVTVRTVNLTADERINGHAHCRALLLGSSACLNIIDGRLLLGQWQRVLLAELDGPRTREVSVLVLGERG
jgi:secondary thiamine-phosphate synthase enzyme